jgi:VWFA-related protein
MSPRLSILTVAILAYAALVAAQGTSAAKPQRPDQDAPTPFRVAVDVVAVDVQVIDKTGRPVPDLGPEKFTVTINGRRRRVVSAEQIGNELLGEGERPIAASASVRGRVIVIAVDCISFDATASRGIIQAIRQFVRQLSPDDFVGLSAYPNGAKLDPTTDHSAVLRALDTVVGQKDLAELSQYHLRPSEIIDLTRELLGGGGPTVDAIVARECGNPVDPVCQVRFIHEVTNTALFYEGQATASLGMLRTIVGGMGAVQGRKTLILVSGGMVASDVPGGRPDLGELGIQVGKEAALANTTIYTLYMESSFIERFSAQTRAGDKSLVNWSRDSTLMGRWLEQFSGAAGGALFSVQVGNAESALARIRTELSSYYLLGVEPGDEDRDGRTHQIAVKTTQPNVTIRGRRWVTVPKRTGTTTRANTPATTPAPATPEPATPTAAPVLTPVRREVPADVQVLADVFDRGNYDVFQRALGRSSDLAGTIRGFRMSDSPWPNDPRRTAVFALEMAIAGLRSQNAYARDEGGRLLAEYHARVRQPSGPDAFECAWFLTEAAALQGLFLPDSAMLFIPRALQRCPNSPRLHLAYAFVSEQQWMRGGVTPEQELEIVRRYEEAMKFPETEPEARVRAARFLLALGNVDRALEVIKAATRAAEEREVRYLTNLVRGQVLRSAGRSDEAVAAFRSALVTWPAAQSARVALMTLLVARGERDEAAALAEATQTASENEFDPWWTYWLGDFPTYPALLDKLRELAR